MDQLVVLKRLHHEEGIVHAAGDIALEDRVAHVSAPHWQSLALTLFEIASPYDRPSGVAGKHAPAGFHLVVNVHGAEEPAEPTRDLGSRQEGR